MMNRVEKTVENTIKEHCLVTAGAHIVTALSGGADSVCLLLVLNALAGDMGFTLSAMHINHSLRGAESDGDEEFCRELCEAVKVPFSSVRVDVMSLVRETGMSTEEAARKLRYDALSENAEKFDGAFIATAHNMCDNAETVLFNIARGTGIKGICGIPYKRGSVIRPLLDVSRRDIEGYLKEKEQLYVTDSTNLTDDYSRNKIRHNVIPVLEEINPSFFESVSRLSASAEVDEKYFSELLSGLSDRDIPSLPSAVRRRYISKMLTGNDIPVSYDRICAFDVLMADRASTKVSLSDRIYAVFRKGVMNVEHYAENDDISVEIKLDSGSRYDIYDKTVKIIGFYDDISQSDSKVHNKLTNSMLNCDKIHGVVRLRNKRDGDRINLAGRQFETRLKKLYNSLGLSYNERRTALVIEDDDGIIWSEYGGAADRVSANDGGKIVIVEVERL